MKELNHPSELYRVLDPNVIQSDELASLRRERDELREAVERLLFIGSYREFGRKDGHTIEELFPNRFAQARALLTRKGEQVT